MPTGTGHKDLSRGLVRGISGFSPSPVLVEERGTGHKGLM